MSAKDSQSRKVRILRAIFRWCRIVFLFAIFLAVVCVVYLNLIGIPNFLKKPLLNKLRDRGVEVEFSRMYYNWYRGIVIENAALRSAAQPRGPKLVTVRTEISLDLFALLKSQIKLKTFLIENGQLLAPLAQSNHVASLDDVAVKLNFLPGDQAQLENFDAKFEGATIHLSGSLTNFSAVRDWKFLHAQSKTNQNFQAKLEQFVSTWKKIRFASGPPELNLAINGDARDLDSLKADLKLSVAAVDTPWGTAKKLKLSTDSSKFLNPGNAKFLRVRLSADTINSRWGNAGKINLTAALSRNAANSNLFETDVVLVLAKMNASWTNQLQTNWIRGSSVQWNGNVIFSPTNFLSSVVSGKLQVAQADSRWGSAGQIKLALQGSATSEAARADASWGAWAKFEPFTFSWQAEARNLKTPKVEVESANCSGQWRAPQLLIQELHANLYDGQLSATAQLDLPTRELRASGSCDFDPHKISPLLTPAGQHWIAQYGWEKPPKVEGALHLILPSWTNRQPDWRGEVLPTLAIKGKFSVEQSSFRGVPVSSGESEFTYSNMTWNLPRIRATRPDGEVFVNYQGNDRTHDYRFIVDSAVNLKAARPLLEQEKAREIFDQLELTQAPKIHAEIWGRWKVREMTGGRAEITATNFIFRGEHVDALSASLQYTNLVLQANDVKILRDGRELTAPHIVADFATKKVSVTNVLSTLEPVPAFRAAGPKVVAAMAPFQFAVPPAVRINGSFVMRDPTGTDLHFEVAGERFSWINLVTDKISGHIDWIGRSVRLTNVQARLYGNGKMIGSGEFNYKPDTEKAQHGTDFKFQVSAMNIDLPAATRSLTEKTNHVEGLFNAELTMTSGNSRDKKSWEGFGQANVHDGLLWDIPVFGIFSPVLNAIVAGAGNTRASTASAKFILTKGIVYSDDLEIRSSGFRLQYRGGVDIASHHIDARVEAEMLRDAWVIGRLISFALTPLSKIFEYKITGSLNHPEMNPTYIPKFLMMTLRPFHTLKHLTNGQPPAPVDPPLPEKKK